ncbi:MAG: response regulator transcription factor [Bacteroidales bacterium]|nr:response regulator transcription factor [Bacteroidales bacterium]HOK98491.1 response regulator transcription factor [Bacteroidales bacterium]HPO66089.1 response regulator transcription factor [Bacteroidales bacterium]
MEVENKKILIVDDEEDILEFVSYNLRKEGYQLFTAQNGRDAIRSAKEHIPHLILLDVMMPDMDGIETCREIRNIPELQACIIAFFTARNEDYSLIAGLDAGADDYITKPIRPRVLVSKVAALLRRHNTQKTASERVITRGKIVIDSEKYLVFLEGKEVFLPRKEFELLHLLASKPGRVFTRDEIFNRIWSDDVIVSDRTIDVHIRKIREKLGDEVIKTVKGVGYKFEQF